MQNGDKLSAFCQRNIELDRGDGFWVFSYTNYLKQSFFLKKWSLLPQVCLCFKKLWTFARKCREYFLLAKPSSRDQYWKAYVTYKSTFLSRKSFINKLSVSLQSRVNNLIVSFKHVYCGIRFTKYRILQEILLVQIWRNICSSQSHRNLVLIQMQLSMTTKNSLD